MKVCLELPEPPEGKQYSESIIRDEVLRMSPEMILEDKTKERWRAERGGWFYFLGANGLIRESAESFGTWEDDRYEIGNYYRTEEEAEAARDRVLKAYKGE